MRAIYQAKIYQGAKNMESIFSDWVVRKTIKVYLSYQHAIHARAKESRPYILHALYAVLIHEGLEAAAAEQDPETGIGYLIVDKRITISVISVPKLIEDEYFWLPINFECELQACSLVFNFGSPEADFLPRPPAEQVEVDCFWKKGVSLCDGSANLLDRSIAKTL
jgi:hypothetical protein